MSRRERLRLHLIEYEEMEQGCIKDVAEGLKKAMPDWNDPEELNEPESYMAYVARCIISATCYILGVSEAEACQMLMTRRGELEEVARV